MKFFTKQIAAIVIFLFFHSIPAQEKQNRKIYLSLFNPYKSNKETGISENIYEKLAAKLKSLGYEVIQAYPQDLKQTLAKSKQEGALLLIDGYYKREANGNLDIYGQIYHPEKEVLIDAFNQSTDLSGI